MTDIPKTVAGFVMKDEQVVKMLHFASPADVVVGVGGELRVTAYDGEVFIFAAGEWTGVHLHAREED